MCKHKKRQKQPTLYYYEFLYWIKFFHVSIVKQILFATVFYSINLRFSDDFKKGVEVNALVFI